MQTFFARHGSQLDIDSETYRKLWNGDLVAIHFPEDRHCPFGKEDARSTDPDDYKNSARGALNAMNELSKNGGYVCATFEPYSGCKLGYVEPGTVIELVEGRWGVKNDLAGRVAVLKTLKMTKTLVLSARDSAVFLVAKPRQGTFCRWHQIKNRVRDLVDGVRRSYTIHDLIDVAQEVMCSEFLRSELVCDYGLPKVSVFLLPVGRTMKDIDILGMDSSGHVIAAQVTYAHLNNASWKLKALKQYRASEKDTLILFCESGQAQLLDGVNIIPIHEVFDRFCSQDSMGRKWLSTVLGEAEMS